MKRKNIITLAAILMAALLLSLLPPVTAQAASDVNTDTYYYDRIPARAQWCYRFLKEYYDSIPLGVKETYRITDFSSVPGGNDAQLFIDFVIADEALKADDPTYQWKGCVAGAGQDTLDGPLTFLLIDGFDLLTKDNRLQAEAKIQQVISAVKGGDRYTQLRKMASWFLDDTFYDPYLNKINTEGNNTLATRGIHYNGSAYGVLLEGIAVCGGFSQAVKVFCNELDIPCIIMGNAGHAWNLVQMEDGKWYRLDITNACRLGQDGELPNSLEYYFENVFLSNDTFGFYGDPYMISVPGFSVKDFPVHAQGQYQYTGSNTDFSYTLPASTYTPGSPKFSYRVNDDGKTCTVNNYEGKESGDLTVPATLDGYTVTAIEAYAFYYCAGFTGKLTIPDTVESIGKAAFAGCYGLTSLQLSKNLYSIGRGAFIGCKGLTQVTLPDNLGEIAEYGFYDCNNLKSVTFGSHIQSVENMAFAQCANSLVIKAPANSAAARYASGNGIAFQTSGTMCSFRDPDGKWVIAPDAHYRTCEHGAAFDRKPHTNAENIFNCGDTCDVCGGEACSFKGVMEKALTLVNAQPATCGSMAYTGDMQCVCGNIVRYGEWTGEATGQHAPADAQWEHDEWSHWQACSCGRRLDDASHTGGTATATQRAKCEVCGAEYGELAPNDPTQPTEGTKPADPTDPTEGTKPADPTNPTEGTKPTDPTNPTEGTKPADPTNPTEGTKPADPTDPTEGTKPEEPEYDTTWITVLLAVLAAAALGVGGFFGWKMMQKKQDNRDAS